VRSTPKTTGTAETAGVESAVPGVAPIAPVMAVRHASDDLCVRWWAEP
jgi:hypothetical protein